MFLSFCINTISFEYLKYFILIFIDFLFLINIVVFTCQEVFLHKPLKLVIDNFIISSLANLRYYHTKLLVISLVPLALDVYVHCILRVLPFFDPLHGLNPVPHTPCALIGWGHFETVLHFISSIIFETVNESFLTLIGKQSDGRWRDLAYCIDHHWP